MNSTPIEYERRMVHWKDDGTLLPSGMSRYCGHVLCYNWRWNTYCVLIRPADDLVDQTFTRWNYLDDDNGDWTISIRTGTFRRFVTRGVINYTGNDVITDDIIRDDDWLSRRRLLEGLAGNGLRSFV